MSEMNQVILGPLTKTIIKESRWRGRDGFPSSQIWADEVERVLSFIEGQGQFEKYLPRFRGNVSQRDGALAEARVAYFFHRNGFKIVSWEPRGASSHLGEFEIQWYSLRPIFVEVKGPRWEGELSDDELKGPRRWEARYVNGEARWFDSISKIVAAAEKAVPKFLPDTPNILVAIGYLLFVSPRDLPRNIVEPRLSASLSNPRFSNIGGVIIFDFGHWNQTVSYDIAFIENVAANELCKIPAEVAKGLSMSNEKFFLR